MDSDTAEKRTEQPTLADANNVIGLTSSSSSEKLRFSGFPNIQKLIYSAQGEYKDKVPIRRERKSSKNQLIEEGSSTDSEIIFFSKNEKAERDIENKNPPLSQPCGLQISRVKKCKLLKTSDGYILRENKDKTNANEKNELQTSKEESSDSDSGEYLPPPLKDLILKSRTNKITRPPNAFMLFAKAQRLKVGVENPSMTNRQISTILGNMWRDLDDDDKAIYYRYAQAMEKLHKERYPGYVYNPSEARLRKQFRIEKKQQQQQRASPILHKMSKCSPPTNISTKLPSHITVQDTSMRVAVESDKCNANGLGTDSNEPAVDGNPNSQANSLDSPLYWPYGAKWAPMEGNHLPVPGMPPFFCPYHVQGINTGLPEDNRPPTNKRDTNSAAKFGNPVPCMPFPRPMFPGDFHPAIWNPWYMFPNPYFLNMRPPSAELHKNWMGMRPPFGPLHFENQQHNSPPQATSQNATKTAPDDNEEEDDDDDPHALVIDDRINDELNKENIPDPKKRQSR